MTSPTTSKKRRPRSPFINFYVGPSAIIFGNLYSTKIGHLEIQTAFLAAFIAAGPLYRLFLILGSRYNLGYSFNKETVMLKRDPYYPNSRFFLKRLLLLYILYIPAIFMNFFGGITGNTNLAWTAVFLAFLIFFYMLIDFFLAIHGSARRN
jgi:hypothetical protein